MSETKIENVKKKRKEKKSLNNAEKRKVWKMSTKKSLTDQDAHV